VHMMCYLALIMKMVGVAGKGGGGGGKRWHFCSPLIQLNQE
jgi:hypothetical protein